MQELANPTTHIRAEIAGEWLMFLSCGHSIFASRSRRLRTRRLNVNAIGSGRVLLQICAYEDGGLDRTNKTLLVNVAGMTDPRSSIPAERIRHRVMQVACVT